MIAQIHALIDSLATFPWLNPPVRDRQKVEELARLHLERLAPWGGEVLPVRWVDNWTAAAVALLSAVHDTGYDASTTAAKAEGDEVVRADQHCGDIASLGQAASYAARCSFLACASRAGEGMIDRVRCCAIRVRERHRSALCATCPPVAPSSRAIICAAKLASETVSWEAVADRLPPSPFEPLLEIWRLGYWPIGPVDGEFMIFEPHAQVQSLIDSLYSFPWLNPPVRDRQQVEELLRLHLERLVPYSASIADGKALPIRWADTWADARRMARAESGSCNFTYRIAFSNAGWAPSEFVDRAVGNIVDSAFKATWDAQNKAWATHADTIHHVIRDPRHAVRAAEQAAACAAHAAAWEAVADRLPPSPFKPLLQVWQMGYWPIGAVGYVFAVFEPPLVREQRGMTTDDGAI